MFGKSKHQSQSELYDEHQREADRQLKITAEQQAETERQLELTKQQQDETQRQLDKSRLQQDEAARQQSLGAELLKIQLENAERQSRFLDQQESLLARLADFPDRQDGASGT
jgi:hypothetical protein